ncbi:MAG: DUF167 domain-containing protein [Planctomycetes bacterium]|nr:DUF167 domain-containing protein [Planctomycetota bacterium]
MSKPAIQEDAAGVVFTAKIVPGSSRTTVAGVLQDMVKIRVAAPPEKGKANQCLVEYLAGQLGVKKNQIDILAGQTNPVKQIRITGVSADTLLTKLGLNAL